jgi:hypothetical protein
MLHILNGDSMRMGIERSGIPGSFVVWPDILYEGPTPLTTGEEWIAARARHLSGVSGSSVDEIAGGYRRNDGVLESFRDHDETVFWLEHDLFDQLLLIRHLWWLKQRGVEGVDGAERAARAVKTSLVCHHTYLGPLKPDAFPPLFAGRQAITNAQLELGSRAWIAVCGSDPSRLVPFATEPSTHLLFLAPALRRFLEEYPSAANGLSRTERQILNAASDGPITINRAFRASAELEEAIFMGDSSFFAIVDALAAGRHPLLTIGEDSEQVRNAAERTIRLTDTGRAVLSGRADHIALNGIDRWLGGVHLTAPRGWRWTGSSLLRAAV